MSSSASVDLLWGDGAGPQDGKYRFRLPIGQLRELQDKCNAGPAEIMKRLRDDTWRIDDVREPIRLGLIGGGMEPVKASVLTKRYVDERPYMENVTPAFTIMAAALIGVPDDPVGKEDEATETREPDASSFPPSTPQPLPSGSQTPAASMN